MLKVSKDKLFFIVRGLLVFLIFWNSDIIQLLFLKLFRWKLSNLTGAQAVILTSISSFILVLIFSCVYWKELKKEFETFRKDFVKNMDTGLQCWMLGLAIMIISNLILNFVLKAGGANNEQAVQGMIKNLPWLMAIDAGIIAPFNEEIVFRKTLKDVFKNKWLFVFLSFLIFGGAHVISQAQSILDILYIVPYGALGGAFAIAYYDTDTVFTSMSMHMIHNTILTLLSILVL